MSVEEDLATFAEALARASQAVPWGYFQLPVAGRETPVYRERVYCYELYHQLRLVLPGTFPYSLTGETDKSGHPLLRDTPLSLRKPDFLVHSTGDMDWNLVAIEVKPGTRLKKGLRKDVDTLLACLERANYEFAILLVYGGAHEEWRRPLRRLVERHPTLAGALDRVKVYWHETAGQPAAEVAWDEIRGGPEDD